MDVFHIADKVFLDRNETEDYEYGKVTAMDIQHNLMTVSLIDGKLNVEIEMNSPQVKKIDFLPNDNVIIHDLMKDYYNKWGVISSYDWRIDRYRVMVGNEPHWFAPFELIPYEAEADPNIYEDNDDWSEHFVKSFSTFNSIKVKLSADGKRAYEYHFGAKPPVDAKGRTEFANLAQLMEVYDPTFIYGDKYMLDNDEVLVKVGD